MRQRVAACLGVGLLVAGLALWLARERAAPTQPTAELAPSSAGSGLAILDATNDAAVTRAGDPLALESESGAAESTASEARDFLLEVVDELGSRVEGVEICLCRESRRSELVDSFESVGSFTADRLLGDSLVRVPGHRVEMLFDGAAALSSAAGGVGWDVFFQARIAGAPAAPHVLDSAIPPAAPIRMIVPRFGSLRVEVTEVGGRPARFGLHVRMRSARLSPSMATLHSFRGAPYRSAEPEDGTCTFDGIEIGKVLAIEVQDRLREFETESICIPGPAAPGEAVVARLTLNRRSAALTGRALWSDGTALAHVVLRLGFFAAEETMYEYAQAEADGRFELRITEPMRERARGAEHLELSVHNYEPKAATPRRRIAAPRLPASGTLELGEVRLLGPEEFPILVSGIAVDEVGTPLADVRFTWDEVASSSATRVEIVDALPSDAAGRFTLRGFGSGEKLRLHATNDVRFLDQPLEVVLPCENLRVVLRRGCTLEGRVVVDPSHAHLSLAVSLVSEGHRTTSVELGPEGFFSVFGARPGLARVEVLLERLPIARLEGVTLTEGFCRDPRLDPLDLRGAVREVPVRILDRDGGALSHTRILVATEEERVDPERRSTDREGRASIFAPAAVEFVLLSVPGHRPVRVRCSADEQDVRLAKSLLVRVHVARPAELEPAFALRWDLVGRGTERLGSPSPEDADFALPGPGRYDVAWILESQRESASRELGRTAIDIPEAASPDELVRLSATPPLEGLRTAMQQLEEDLRRRRAR